MNPLLATLRISLIATLLWLAGCASGPTIVPESVLAAEASSQFRQMQQELPLSSNREHIDQINRIGQRIAAVASPYMDSVDWEFVVFDDPAINAFAMPGGKVGFFTGLIELADSDDEIAVVMGHEVAHVLLRHGNQRVSAELLRTFGAAILIHGTSEQDPRTQAAIMAAYGVGTQFGVMLPYSRSHETEADEVGLVLMFLAGYDPDAAPTFWRKMERKGSGGIPTWMSTHPNPANRVANLEQLAAELKANPPDSLQLRR